jgi:DNA polymerase alpha subunit B
MAVITNHNLTPHDIATVWDVFAINSQAEKLTLENWSSFRVALDKEIAKTPSQTSSKKKTAAVVSRSAMGKRSSSSTAATTTHSSASPTNVSKKVRRDSSQPDMQLEQIVNGNVTSSPQKNSNGGDDSLSLALVTPPKSTSTPTSDNVVLYSTRQHAGETVLTYNPHNLSPIESNSQGSVRTCMISQPFPTHLSGSYRYMTDASRHLSLDRHLQSMTEKMIKSHGIPVSIDQGDVLEDAVDKDSEESTTFQNVGVPRQSLQTNIGRICNDAHDGKLNATSLLLEGTRHGSNGARIELDVTDVSNYCLFQGQIVAVTGVNSNGRKMVVKHVMEGLDCKGQEEDMCKSRKEVFGKEGLKVYAVAGPYTTSSDLEYQPLVDFMGLIAEEKPDVVLMMGPFVDMRQEIVKNGEDLVLECEDGTKTHVCYEQFFAAKVAAELETLYEEDPDLKTQFVLVPSMDDAVSEPV